MFNLIIYEHGVVPLHKPDEPCDRMNRAGEH